MTKEIIINEGNLQSDEVNERKQKSRLIIINDKNQILLQNYDGVFMLPGGKIDDNETIVTGLVREIREETGLVIKPDEIKPLVITKNYVRNYPRRDSSYKINKLVETSYFYLRSNSNICKEQRSLTLNEKKCNLTSEFVDINNISSFINNNNSINPRKKYYDEELIKVLEEFKNTNIIDYNSNDKLIDMHIHSCYSDGDYEPEEIAKKVKQAGINVFSITDHDTVLGCMKLDGYCDPGIMYIPGIELNASIAKGRMHILGYNLDIYNERLSKLLQDKKKNSFRSIELMYQYMHNKYGVNIPSFDLNNLFEKIGNIGRPDLALLLRKYGYANDNNDAFKKYLVEAYNKTYYDRITTSKEECIEVLKKAGAYISLAHPISLEMGYEELREELIYLKSLGLDAIEICHSNQSEEYRNILRRLRDELSLYETGGSDYHGPNVKPDIQLGTGINNNIQIKELKLLNKMQN